MYPLFTTIKLEKNKLLQLDFHNQRVNHTRKELFGSNDNWNIADMIDIPVLDQNKIYRCRFLYNKDNYGVEFIPYQPKHITKLYLVQDDQIDYSYKYTDRSRLDALRKQLPNTHDSDVLIVKNGLVTETSLANIVFSDGNKWYTPDTPLLKGTQRAYYLAQGILTERRISPADLRGFNKARLINAMLDLNTGNDITMDNIHNSCF
ncbi:MAG: aminotransferase class IV [Bacteroidales bacterium]|nr:aminotransferase class IV [Bacteroidales bacterium]